MLTKRLLTVLYSACVAATISTANARAQGAGETMVDVFKFYDANASGTLEPGEAGVEFVTIAMFVQPAGGGAGSVQIKLTGPDGIATFDVPIGAHLTICERVPTSETPGQEWIQTMPNPATVPPWNFQVTEMFGSFCYEGIAPPVDCLRLAFGNVCVGGNGNTPGFWHNQNGAAVLAANDPAWRILLNASNLRTESGAHFDVPLGVSFSEAHAVFSDWLLGATGTNMAYKLSSHLAAMQLNVQYGFVPATSMIFAPGTQSANASGFANVLDLIQEANAELGLHGTALPGDPWRPYQEALKNALDAANNDEDFVQEVSCGVPC